MEMYLFWWGVISSIVDFGIEDAEKLSPECELPLPEPVQQIQVPDPALAEPFFP